MYHVGLMLEDLHGWMFVGAPVGKGFRYGLFEGVGPAILW